jgi:hypothetical protein
MTGGGLRLLGRGVAVGAGLILFVVGLLAAVLPILYVLLLASSLVDDSAPPGMDSSLLILAGVAVVATWFGLRFIRGRRRLGLFLRKFGFRDSTETVTYALAAGVGRTLRLVTLDDAMVAPVGVSRPRRWAGAWLFLLGGAAVVAGLIWFLGGGFDAAVKGAADDAVAQAGGDGSLEDAIGGIFAAAIGAAIATLVILIVVMVPVAIAATVALFGGTSYLAARRAQRSATRAISDERSLAPTVRSIAARSRRIFGARLVVVAVTTALWRSAVQRLAAVADIVVVDVSQPTENLIWELAAIRTGGPGRCVLVGAHDHVAVLAYPDRLAPGSVNARLAQLLEGAQIVAYEPGKAGLKRFARALRGACLAPRT